MRVSASQGNANVSYSGDKRIIEIPSKKSIFSILFLCFWLCGWAFGLLMVGRIVLFGGGPKLFMTAWLLLWTIGGGMAIAQLAWMCFGIEVIEVDRKQLSVVKKALFYKSSREYDVKDIRNIRVVEYDTVGHGRNRRDRRYSIRGGLINFDYGMKTIKFGINIDPAEATHLINEHLSWINTNSVI